ncbi:MAG: alpha-glucosidase, partial [Terracidiphilus sp.]
MSSILKFAAAVALGMLFLNCRSLWSADTQIVLTRPGRTVVVEPYAPNIVRITLSSDNSAAVAAPGYGFVGAPSMTGWTHERDSAGNDVIRSGRMVIRVAPENLPPPRRLPLDPLNESLRAHYFGGGPPSRNRSFNDSISIVTASGKPLLVMRSWAMFPNRPEGSSAPAENAQKSDPGYRVSATFDSPAGEHYYGLGQHQQGFLDLRDHRIDCWHEYNEIGGETVCVPFMVSSRDYGLIWDNP